jgi:hypothetical protein
MSEQAIEGAPLDPGSRMNPRLQWVLRIRDSNLPPTQRLIAYALETFMDADATCFPSIAAIASATGLHRRSVERQLPQLHRRGWLHRKGSMQGRRGGRPISVWEGRVPFAYAEFPDVD